MQPTQAPAPAPIAKDTSACDRYCSKYSASPNYRQFSGSPQYPWQPEDEQIGFEGPLRVVITEDKRATASHRTTMRKKYLAIMANNASFSRASPPDSPASYNVVSGPALAHTPELVHR